MNSKHLVDPALVAALESSTTFVLTPEILPVIRAGMNEMARQRLAEPAADVAMEERFVPGLEGAPDVRILIFSPVKPAEGLRSGYLHTHGGGYVMGSADMSLRAAESVVRATGAVVIDVDYRLAPETPHPGPLNDCYAALTWFHAHAGELGVDPARIAIGGDSAGGGLTAALALFARDRGGPRICFQVLNYPMLDDRPPADPHPSAGEFVWNQAANAFGWRALLGREPGGPDVSPYAAAARAEDLSGLPPTFIGIGGLDLFLEENLEYARRLMRAGVPTELHVYPGGFHGFDMMVEDADVSKRYRRDGVQALVRALAAN